MFKSLGKMWVAFSVLFAAFEAFAQMLLTTCKMGQDMMDDVAETAAIERKAARIALEQAIISSETPKE